MGQASCRRCVREAMGGGASAPASLFSWSRMASGGWGDSPKFLLGVLPLWCGQETAPGSLPCGGSQHGALLCIIEHGCRLAQVNPIPGMGAGLAVVGGAGHVVGAGVGGGGVVPEWNGPEQVFDSKQDVGMREAPASFENSQKREEDVHSR